MTSSAPSIPYVLKENAAQVSSYYKFYGYAISQFTKIKRLKGLGGNLFVIDNFRAKRLIAARPYTAPLFIRSGRAMFIGCYNSHEKNSIR